MLDEDSIFQFNSDLRVMIIIISLTSIFFQDKSRVWTAASQQHLGRQSTFSNILGPPVQS